MKISNVIAIVILICWAVLFGFAGWAAWNKQLPKKEVVEQKTGRDISEASHLTFSSVTQHALPGKIHLDNSIGDTVMNVQSWPEGSIQHPISVEITRNKSLKVQSCTGDGYHRHVTETRNYVYIDCLKEGEGVGHADLN